MAFPLLAILASVLSDQQQRKAAADAKVQTAHDATSKILRTRAAELGGSPYPMMEADMRAQMSGIDREADASRNNNIGNLLARYGSDMFDSAPAEKFGDAYDSSFVHQPNLQYNTDEGIRIGDSMGKAQLDPWDKDPWGDAGF